MSRHLKAATLHSSPAATSRRAGFTLLEVLTASLLSATLLAGLWQLMSMNLRLFESGHEVTEQAQIVRALRQQFTDDLRSAISPNARKRKSRRPRLIESKTEDKDIDEPSVIDPFAMSDGDQEPREDVLDVSEVESPVRASGFFGTRRTMQLDVLQPTGEEIDFASEGRSKPVRKGELRTIIYQFRPPDMENDSRVDVGGDPSAYRRVSRDASSRDEPNQRSQFDRMPPGLTRQEMAWTPRRARRIEALQPARSANPPAKREGSLDERRSPRNTDSADVWEGAKRNDRPITRIPEVTWLEFRYFDGARWSDRWDSRRRKSLPLAVAVAVRLASDEDARDIRDEMNLSSRDDSIRGPHEGMRSQASRRLLIRLPASPQPLLSPRDDQADRSFGSRHRPRAGGLR